MTQTYTMCAGSVDLVAAEIVKFLEGISLENKLILKYRLSAEEALNRWLEKQICSEFVLKTGKRFGSSYISLEAAGMSLNPFEVAEDESNFINNILVSLTNAPQYNYVKGRNIIRFNIQKKQMNQLLKMLITLAIGGATGALLKAILPNRLIQTLLSGFIDPLYSAAFRLLGGIAGPVILLSVTWGIYGIGDSATLSRVGKKLILTFLSVTFTATIVTGILFPLFRLNIIDAAKIESPVAAIFTMLLDIIPKNIVQPFLDGNTLQIIFIAVVFGMAMLFLGKRVSTVADIVDQINCIVQFMMDLIGKLIPVFIYLIVVRLILNNTFVLIKTISVLVLIFFAIILMIMTVMTLWTSIHCRVSPLLLVKKSLPTFLIAITTASSAACFGSNIETCENRLGIGKSLSSFGIPLGMVMAKLSTAAYFVLLSYFYGAQMQVECSWGWLISAVFMSGMLSIAVPPIPGGSIIAYTMLFNRLGIPEDALAIVLSVDIMFDFFRTSTNMYCLPLTLVNVASKLGLLDTEILKRKTE